MGFSLTKTIDLGDPPFVEPPISQAPEPEAEADESLSEDEVRRPIKKEGESSI